eukprot:2771893-Rhodomonas_salina.4
MRAHVLVGSVLGCTSPRPPRPPMSQGRSPCSPRRKRSGSAPNMQASPTSTLLAAVDAESIPFAIAELDAAPVSPVRENADRRLQGCGVTRLTATVVPRYSAWPPHALGEYRTPHS